ncbi:MAG: hypothetical protein GWN61_06380 [candidate division Zixibacteria bacterium]|nr:hypothetical protein [candidate division Zixibacteria bacterium]NIS14735.1 hypothetical protein [candidate division Zixibacteria bacterium]NIS45647.1 hypothetical protein [candidate division Zixibacteria bacterium]NIU13775.1 hypothetical protein [candidate division Zixibacteria bacterium]NIV05813.1 hypothetical protein [candidate division Zixibacteria bacterium]
MELLKGMINLISIIGFLSAIILWIMAMNRAVSDDVHFKLKPIWKIKREWFKPPGFQLYVAAYIALVIGIITSSIYYKFLA